ncbi:MAG: tripartite tricarboxylate transporter TctB family protein [Gammaproteobacteria bacterium]|nr:tripartite tricarboxylate transporter TctB family protein [Gammaproteobacteria bacterium]
MTSRAQDACLAVVLLLIGCAWTYWVIKTIPPGFGDGEIGPRAFPLVFGVVLIGLATLLLAWPVFTRSGDTSDAEDSTALEPSHHSIHWVPALIVLVEIILYGFLLNKIGFLLATPVIVVLVMLVSLRVRSLPKLFITALGLTFGCWLIFEKIMGIYLAKGTWVNFG